MQEKALWEHLSGLTKEKGVSFLAGDILNLKCER